MRELTGTPRLAPVYEDINANELHLSTIYTLDNIADGTLYSKVLTADISAGHILLSSVTQSASYRTVNDTEKGVWNGKPDDFDELGEGVTYKKILATQISSGRIILTAANYYSGKFTGEWYSMGVESGVDIDAVAGINIYGKASALTTRATKTGTIQCYVGADGKIYAGAGACWLDVNGVNVKSSSFRVLDVNDAVVGTIGNGTWESVYAMQIAGYNLLRLYTTIGHVLIDTPANKNIRLEPGAGGFSLINAPKLGGDLNLNGHNIDFPTTPNISDCLDEDTMVSNSATKLATQQSIKAYADTKIANSVTESAPTRVLNTEYQNTSGKIRLIAVTCICEVYESGVGATASGASRIMGTSGAISPFLFKKAEGGIYDMSITSSGSATLLKIRTTITFIVPNNYYYKVETYIAGDGVTPVLDQWLEWDLG